MQPQRRPLCNDLGQTVAKWGAADAASFTNLHRTIVVFPRITHAETLQTISTILGYRWETRSSTNSSTSCLRTGSSAGYDSAPNRSGGPSPPSRLVSEGGSSTSTAPG